jgi:hypothetical protein
MDLLKKLVRERKICRLYIDGFEFDEWLIVDLNTTSYIICDITEPRCWQVPKLLSQRFLSQFYRNAEKIEVRCPS